MEAVQELSAICDKLYAIAEKGISKATEENKPELKTLFLELMLIADFDKNNVLKRLNSKK